MAPKRRGSSVEIPTLLVEAIKNRRCIIFLGAGASKEAQDPTGQCPPDADQLRDILADHFFNRQIKNRDVMAVAEMAAATAGGLPQVFEVVRKSFESFEPSEAHKLLPTFQWKMIATTNYDLLIDRAYSDFKNKLQSLARFVKDDEPIETRMEALKNPVEYLKLHGCFDHLLDPDIPLILSREHYRNYSRNRERLFARLRDKAREFPIVFIGYRLDDAHVRELIYSLSGNKRQKWYIVTPDAEDYDVDFYATKNIGVLKCKFGQFMSAVNDAVLPLWRTLAPTDNTSDFPIRRHYIKNADDSDELRLSLKRDLTLVYAGMPAAEQTAKQFYEGYDTGWGGILLRFDVRRRKEEDLLFKALLENDTPKAPTLLVLRGAAGAGKTIALKRTAYEAATGSDALILWLNDNGVLRPEIFQEMYELTNKTIYLFVDQIALRADKVLSFLQVMRIRSIPIVVVAAERDSDWNTYCSSLNSDFTPQFLRLGNLSRAEIVGLLELLEKHDCLGRLREKSRDEQIQAFEEKEQADRQLLVALHELTLGKPFEEIVLDEHMRVYPEEARQLYLDIATLHQFSVKARAGTISRVSGIDFSEYKDKFLQPLQDIVRIDENDYTEDYYYQTRHARVASIVFKQICQTDELKSMQFMRIIDGLDPGYSSDLRAIQDMTRGWQLHELFASPDAVRKIYHVAVARAPRLAFLYQQWAIFESNHVEGSLVDAEGYAEQANKLNPTSRSITHTQAEVDRKRANEETSPLLKQSLRRRSRQRLSTLPAGDRFASSSRCKLLVDELVELGVTLDRQDAYLDVKYSEHVRDTELALRKAQQLHPDDADIIQVEARFRREIDQKEAALKALERALKAGPRGSSTAIRVSKQYDNQGRTEKAYRVLRDALQKAPDDKMLHEALAFHYLSAGSYSNDLVEDHFRRSFAVGYKNFEERFNLAQFLYLRGEVQKSVEMFDYINVHAPPEFRTMNPSKDNLITSKLSRFIGSIDRVREGYFFIKCAHYPRDIFSHRSASSLDIVDDLSVGQEVNFKMRFNRRGATAVDVKLGRYGATG